MNWKSIKSYMGISRSKEIARRYFIINSFDGALTTLGAIIGANAVGSGPRVVVSVVIGISIAMMISGFTGSYMSERAEKMQQFKDIEKAMLKGLRKSILGKAFNITPFLTATVDGISPFMASIIILLPYLLYLGGLYPFNMFYSSLGLGIAYLFMLGLYLGRIAKESIWIAGLKTAAIGIGTALIVNLVGKVF